MEPAVLDRLVKIVEDYKSRDIVLNDEGIFDAKARKAWGDLVRHKDWPEEQKEVHPFTREEMNTDAIMNAIRLIPLLFKRTTRKGINSYRSKHIVEQYLKKTYLSNGEAILAFAYCRYEIAINKREGDWNCQILALLRDPQVARPHEEYLRF